jgi:hypothetical protein
MPRRAQLLAGGEHAAGQRSRRTHVSFEEADRNKDGFLDKSEAGRIPGLSANFERADRNQDGKLGQGRVRQRAYRSSGAPARCSSCAWSRRQPTRRPPGGCARERSGLRELLNDVPSLEGSCRA